MQDLTTEKLDLQTQLAKIRSRLEYDFGGAQSTGDQNQNQHDGEGHQSAARIDRRDHSMLLLLVGKFVHRFRW